MNTSSTSPTTTTSRKKASLKSSSTSVSSASLSSITNEDGHVMGDWYSLNLKDNIVWAKLRGYPWWPAIVKQASDAPSELLSTAEIQIKSKTSILVYFFGSHDFSLIPIENIRPFWENIDFFSSQKTGSKVKMAIKEAKKYSSTSTAKPLQKEDNNFFSHINEENPNKEDPIPNEENIALYCRLKIQKIVLRKNLKKSEIPILEKLITRLEDENIITYRSLITTQISRIIKIALSREEFSSPINMWSPLKGRMEALLKRWRKEMLDYIYDLGL